MRRDLVKELRRMVRSYSGKPRETRALLEGIAIAGTEGVTAEDLADVLGKLREKLAKNAA
jgi:chromosome segregation and condensation protein ScpB